MRPETFGRAREPRDDDWASRHLRIANASYDETIRRFRPGYDELIARPASLVAEVVPCLVTDLGSGTGSLAEVVLENRAVGAVRLIDSDESMLERARERLARFGGRVRFTLGAFTEPFDASDAVCTSLALHHVPLLEAKRELYRDIFQRIRRGGVFVNADVAMSGDEEGDGRIYDYWADHMVASGIERERAFRGVGGGGHLLHPRRGA